MKTKYRVEKPLNLSKQESLNRQTYYVAHPVSIGEVLTLESVASNGNVWFLKESGERICALDTPYPEIKHLKKWGWISEIATPTA